MANQSRKKEILINFKSIARDKALNAAEGLKHIPLYIRQVFRVSLAVRLEDARSLCAVMDDFPIYIQGTFSDLEAQLSSFPDTRELIGSQVWGVILNHPESQMAPEVLEANLISARQLGLEVILCATTLAEAVELNNAYAPEYIAIENKELIGKDISISEYCPGMIREAIACIDNRVLFGGGIRSSRDLQFILQHGGSGVLVSSLILKADLPLAAVENLLNPGLYELSMSM